MDQKKKSFEKDLWIDHAAEPGEQQCVPTLVSETYTLQQLKNTIELRHAFLEEAGLNKNHVLRTAKERHDFLRFAKSKYHEQSEQREKQKRDMKEGGILGMQKGKHSRWGCEMQRRCGSKSVWEVVSFTGECDHKMFAKLWDERPDKTAESTDRDTQATLKQQARLARDQYRYAASAQTRQQKGYRVSGKEMAMIKLYECEKLRKDANRATRTWGHGRLKHKDGTFTDIGGNTGGATRKVLDDWEPPSWPDSTDDEMYKEHTWSEFETYYGRLAAKKWHAASTLRR